MGALPGVKVGPLDPESTAGFGQVNQRNSARQLIRLHRQMYPAALKRALVKKLDEPRTTALDLDEVTEHVSGLQHDNGDPLVPEGAKVTGATVRGEPRTGQVLTFQYELPSGRVGKWFAPYTEDGLPNSFGRGAELAKFAKLREAGVVAFDTEGTRTEILQRHNAELRRQNNAFQRWIEAGGEGDPPEHSGELDTRGQAPIAGDLERIGRENEELKARNAELEQLAKEVGELRSQVASRNALDAARGGGVPTGGVDETVPPQDTVASADPPFEGYDDLKADEVASRLKDAGTSQEERERILAYERTHANRKSVVSAGEQALTSGSGA